MDRQTILNEYRINERGTICNPGQFEGEMLYVPYFWDAFLNGMADRDNGNVIGFNLTKDDKAIFPELKGKRTVRIRQTDQGFVVEC